VRNYIAHKSFRLIIAALFIASVPALLISTNVRMVINMTALYNYGFARFDIHASTGIEHAELMSAAAQIREYFNNDEDLLNVRVFDERGIRRSIFNDREILHMRDVKGLVNGVRMVQFSTGFFLITVLAVGFVAYRRQFTPVLAELASLSGLATLGLVVLVGLSSLIGFDRLFLAFHLISFSNDLWQLDPNTDLLIAMFPQNFFFSATMIIASLSITQALILTIIRPLWLKTAPWRPIQRRHVLSSCRKV